MVITPLTGREQQVFRLVAHGKSDKRIGELLALSPRTVETHRAAILHKLELRDTVEMAHYAMDLGIIDAGPEAVAGLARRCAFFPMRMG